ncbi:MAG: hypothetical protein DRR19_04690 [Candidatus Parabeggiatoa sp. nov. 1]|nr:MAG: hypothetical protein DRR19_04690 [Gammaproteobacteria bacterium]
MMNKNNKYQECKANLARKKLEVQRIDGFYGFFNFRNGTHKPLFIFTVFKNKYSGLTDFTDFLILQLYFAGITNRVYLFN